MQRAAVGFVAVKTRRRAQRHGDPIFRILVLSAALFVLLSLGAAAFSMFYGGLPAFRKFGLGFIYRSEWDPVRQDFGALVPIFGTLVTSAIAMVIAVPVSFGIAVFLTELCPNWLRGSVAAAIELLAGIPSIIYGMWGLFVFVPFMSDYIEPWLSDTFGDIPVLNTLFDGPPLGIGMLTAGIILAVMVIPFISSVMRDVFSLVPTPLREAAFGLGATKWEVDPWRRPSLYADGGGWRHLPRPGARPGRDDGGDLRAGQCTPIIGLAAGAREIPSRRPSPTSSRKRIRTSTFRPSSDWASCSSW